MDNVAARLPRLKHIVLSIPDWLWLVIISAVLRLIDLGKEGLWYDETFTAWVSGRLNMQDMARAIVGDVHPPLWYLIEKAVITLLGSSEWAMRLPSAILGVVAVLILWAIALEVTDRRTAFIAGLLCAVMPAALYYSQEARMYSLLTVFVLLMVWCALRSNWVVFVAAAYGALSTQNLALLYVVSIGAAIFIQHMRAWKTLIRPAIAFLGIAGLYIPLASIAVQQARDVSDGFWLQPLTLGGAFVPFASMIMGWRLPDWALVNVYGVSFAMTGIGVIALIRRCAAGHRDQGVILFLATFGALALAALISMLWHTIYLPRAFLPTSFLVMILWANALTQFSSFTHRTAPLILAISLGIGVVAHYFPKSPRDTTLDEIQPIMQQWQPGDVIFHTAIHTAISVGYYMPDKPYFLRPYASDLNQSLTETTKAAMGFSQAKFDDVLHKGFHRIWVVAYTNPMSRDDERTLLDQIAARPDTTVIFRKSVTYAEQDVYLVTLVR